MVKLPYWFIGLLASVCLILLSAKQSQSQESKRNGDHEMKVHFVEIVSKSVDKERKALEQVHGITFGPKVKDLGGAQVAKIGNGVSIALRAPLAEHEQPIVRIYFKVDDIKKAVNAAEKAGAVIAYPPTKQGETGTWAIYILDGIQHGLWQK